LALAGRRVAEEAWCLRARFGQVALRATSGFSAQPGLGVERGRDPSCHRVRSGQGRARGARPEWEDVMGRIACPPGREAVGRSERRGRDQEVKPAWPRVGIRVGCWAVT
jgi:hypothetical protein